MIENSPRQPEKDLVLPGRPVTVPTHAGSVKGSWIRSIASSTRISASAPASISFSSSMMDLSI
jgi:hypothetical protein